MLQEILSLPVLLTLGKITALLVAAFVIAPFIKHPSLRASLWVTTILALPLITVFSSSFSVLQLIPNQKEVIPTVTQTTAATALPLETESSFLLDSLDSPIPSPDLAESSAPQPTIQVASEPATSFPWLTLIYFLGITLVLLPVLSSQIKLRLLKKSKPSGTPQELWQTLSSSLPTNARLHFTPSPSAPFASGILKPSILIPHESQTWSATRLQSTLLHEVAHLKRHDPLTRFLSSLVKALLWFHPLVWLAHRQLIASQEQACDQYALTFGIEPEDYAADLLRSASHSHTTPSQALAMARWSQIGNRVRHILNSENHRPTTMKKITATCTIVALMAFAISSLGFAKNTTDRSITITSLENTVAYLTITPEAKAGKISKLINQLHQSGAHLIVLQDLERKNAPAHVLFNNGNPVIRLSSDIPSDQLLELAHYIQKKHSLSTAEKPKRNWPISTSNLKYHSGFKDRPSQKTLNKILHSSYFSKSIFKFLPEVFETQEEAASFLINNIRVTKTNAPYVSIEAQHPQQTIASRIANTSAQVYLSYLKDFPLQIEPLGRQASSAKIESLNKELLKNRQTLTVLIQKHGAPFFEDLTTTADHKEALKKLLRDKRNLSTLIKKLIERDDALLVAAGLDPKLFPSAHPAVMEYQRLKATHLANLEGGFGSKHPSNIALEQQIAEQEKIVRTQSNSSNKVAYHHEKYRETLGEIDQLVALGLGPNHPEMKAVKVLVDYHLKEAKAALPALQTQLEGRLKLTEQRLKGLTSLLKLNSTEIDQLKINFKKAKNSYEASRKALKEAKTAHERKLSPSAEILSVED